ncbi:MAG TPA: NAD(P)/FAD-dependent oxidoreductase [Stellaceae bacterium]|nr:NAD(P)/FAD-dependent oxidoreductase [Stellaceae bacterium]
MPDIHTSLRPLPRAETALAALTAQARRDLAILAHPAAEWVKPLPEAAGRDVRDVVIIGAGQAGLAVGLALKREGVRNVVLLDHNPAGYEGPWDTFARMVTLRTPKTLVGIELGIPSLSARAWFEAIYGAEAWEQITWIPRRDWMRYLRWYRSIADLDIKNETEVTGIAPDGRLLQVSTSDGPLLARCVVVCTGHDAGGKWAVPEIIERALPPHVYTHSNAPIDFAALAGKRIGVLGHGGSAFDAGLAALAEGAASVDLCFRRKLLPVVNPHRWLEWSGFLMHYRDLDNRTRWNIGRHFDLDDQPPPRHTYDRARAEPRLRAHGDSAWTKVVWNGAAIGVGTPHACFTFDHVICATGVRNGLEQRPELQGIVDDIALWSDRYAPPPEEAHPEMGKLPYLGHHFEFLEKRPGTAPWLARIFAFNFSGFVSMGPVASSITGHRFGVPRVVGGITKSFLLDQEAELLPSLRAFKEPEIDPAATTMYSPAPPLAADGS